MEKKNLATSIWKVKGVESWILTDPSRNKTAGSKLATIAQSSDGLPSGNLTYLLKMTIYSGFSH